MKKLILMRHAKSDWNHANLSDHQRPLNPRGKGDAPRMGALLQDEGIEIDMILCSTAYRTRETLALFLEEYTFEGDVKFLKQLYEADLHTYLDVLAELPDEVETAMLIGHNPTMSSALEFFTDSFEPFKTAAVAYVQFDAERWDSLIENSTGKLLGYWTPRDIE
jgi:phosphohistidine phosphatase